MTFNANDFILPLVSTRGSFLHESRHGILRSGVLEYKKEKLRPQFGRTLMPSILDKAFKEEL